MALREYAGAAKRTTITGSMATDTTTFSVLDATGYPTGITAPFVVAVDLGVSGEEKMLVTRSGNTFTVVQRGFDDTAAAAHNAGASVDHVLSATDIREINAHVFSTTGDAHPEYLTPAEGAELYATATHTHTSSPVTKTVRIPHTFTISGEVKVASGDDNYIPPFFVPVPAGQAVKVVALRHRINSGTSATVLLMRNGSSLSPFTSTVTTTTGTTDPADVTLADGDSLALVVNAVSGTPKNLTCTVYLDYTV